MKKTNRWMNANNLTINAAKTHVMVISLNINNSKENISLSCVEFPIRTLKAVKYLGLTIDNKLNFSQYIKL